MIELTEPLQTAVEQSQNQPVRVVNPRTNEEFVLLRADLYETVKSLLADGLLPQTEEDARAANELPRLTPPNAKLRELAAKYPPPSEYFEGDEPMPFDPIED
jgi:hypothetical protein